MAATLLARRAGALRSSLPLMRPRTFVTLSPEVSDAVARGQPVVTLESTIVSHGLPYPRNLEAARAVEEMVRSAGAVPATTALIDGQALVGLTPAQLERLAQPPAEGTPAPVKTSRRDIARVLAAGKGAVGGTTVSGTMVLSHAAGIPIFATGGIGGVHRGGHNSLDVSADLAELGRTPVAVFCSGAKSILDIPRTLEYLETQGVSVAAFRQASESASRKEFELPSAPRGSWAAALSTTTAFPSFYTAASTRQVPLLSGTEHAAALIAASRRAKLGGGMVFGVPIPIEHEMGEEITAVVEQAVRESEEQGIASSGKDATPWLLKRVKELCPASVDSNVALVTNNAKLAAWTAVDLAALQAAGPERKVYPSAQPTDLSPSDQLARPWLTVVGGAVLDITAQLHGEASRHSTAPGTVRASLGGVGRNMAEAAQRMLDTLPLAPHAPGQAASPRGSVQFVGPTTGDTMAMLLKTLWSAETPQLRMDGLVHLPQSEEGTPTASLMLYANGDLEQGVIQASLVERLADTHVDAALNLQGAAPTAVLDGNLSVPALRRGLALANQPGGLALVEPTSVTKSVRGVEALLSSDARTKGSTILTPNLLELRKMTAHALHIAPAAFGATYKMVEAVRADEPLLRLLDGDEDGLAQLLTFTDVVGPVALTLGAQGVLLALPPAVLAQLPQRVQERTKGTTWRLAGFGAGGMKVWELVHVPPPLQEDAVVSTTGAGDTFAGALVALLRASRALASAPSDSAWSHLISPRATLALAQAAAIQTLASPRAVGEVHRLASLPELEPVWKDFFAQGP